MIVAVKTKLFYFVLGITTTVASIWAAIVVIGQSTRVHS